MRQYAPNATHHQATVCLLEPGKGPLGLESWDDLFHWSPTIFLGLPDALRELRPEPTLPELLAEGLCSIPFVCRDVLETLAGAPCFAWAPLDRLEPWEDLGALIPVGRCEAMCPRHPVALGEAVDEEALALPPVGNALAPPSQGEKAPATAPYSQRIIPWSSAIPSIRAGLAASGPSACHRCSQRCVALFDAHGSPRGTAHHRQPVIKMYNNVCNTLRKGACGIPRPRFGGAEGKTSSNKRYSKSLTPSKRPAILSSYVQIEQYSTKIILVG
jgi:hypothetical protein